MPGQNQTRGGNNYDGVSLLTLSAASASVNGTDQKNLFASGMAVVIDITAITGTTPSLTVVLEGKDPVSGKYFTILSSAALNSVGTTVLRVFPGATAAANLTVNDRLPKTFRVRATIAGTTPSVTATIGGILHAM